MIKSHAYKKKQDQAPFSFFFFFTPNLENALLALMVFHSVRALSGGRKPLVHLGRQTRRKTLQFLNKRKKSTYLLTLTTCQFLAMKLIVSCSTRFISSSSSLFDSCSLAPLNQKNN